MTLQHFPLWDIPTRLFHWIIVCCIPLAWWTAEIDNYDVHQWIGYTVIVLVSSRIAWGFLGSRHSRFSDFLVGPGRVLAYVRGSDDYSAGHNPLGGWSVMVLLALLLTQGVTGLFNTDEVLFSGPLYYWASSDLRDTMGALHETVFNVLLAMIGLHIFAVCYHQFKRREALLQAMILGRGPAREGRAPVVHWWRAVAIVAVLALAFWWALGLAPQPTPMAW